MRNGKGEIIGFVGISVDMSELKANETQLEKVFQEIKSAAVDSKELKKAKIANIEREQMLKRYTQFVDD